MHNQHPVPSAGLSAAFAARSKSRRVPLRLLLLAATLLVGLRAEAAPTFTDMSVPLGEVPTGAGAWADFDRDGDLDLILTLRRSNVPLTRLFRNDGAGSLTELDIGLPGLVEVAFAITDYDRDGWLDFIVQGGELDAIGFATSRTLLCHNEGGLIFTITMPFPASRSTSLAWGDFDGDGDPDLLQAGTLYRNDGAGRFAPVDFALPTPASIPSAWIDYDGDGDLDVVPSRLRVDYNQLASVQLNHAGEAFTAFELVVTNTAPDGWRLAWADVDGDGDLDVAGNPYLGYPVLLRNHGAFSFIQIPTPAKYYSASCAWGDADNDGDWDLLFTGNSYTSGEPKGADLLLNSGTGVFLSADLGLTAGFGGEVSWADLDRDGDLDFLLASSCLADGCFPTRLFRNDGIPANHPPAAPGGLSATTLPDGGTRLTWSAPADTETTNRALLSYELRVGTSPGAANVMSPPADPATGLRCVVSAGPARSNQWVFRNLPVGTYYWSVQAVDAVFAGSPWAPETTFRVTNTPPRLHPLTNQTTTLAQPVTVALTLTDAEDPAESLVVRVETHNPLLLPQAGLVTTGTGSNRVLTLSPAPGQIGTAPIAVTVHDPAGLQTRREFALNVELFSPEKITFGTNVLMLRLSDGPVADYDQDGDLDFLVGGYRDSPEFFEYFVRLAQNDGQGHFTLGPALSTNTYGDTSFRGVVADFDRDGILDLVKTGDAILYLGTGNGTFEITPTSLPIGSGLAGDADGDGDADLLWTADNLTRLFLNQNATFTAWPEFLPVSPSLALAFDDLDRDGDRDVLSAGVASAPSGGSVVRLLRNAQPWLFPTAPTDLPIQGTPYNVLIADDDQDGDRDVIAFLYSGQIEHFANDGQGNLTSSFVSATFAQGAADLDNDGDLDGWAFVRTSDSPPYGHYQLHLSDGYATFIPAPVTISQLGPMADFDGDGDLDLLAPGLEPNAYGVSQPTLMLYRNGIDRPNSAPLPPAGLSSLSLPDDPVHFRWVPAADDHTPTPALSFNLRVGTAPGAADVVSPLSDLATGTRHLAAAGNAATAPLARLGRLPPGTYYWSVQAIDGQGLASTWAPEQTFTLVRPTISPLVDLTLAPGLPSRPVLFTVTGGHSALAALTVFAAADDPSLIPDEALTLTGTGAERSLIVTPANQSGDTKITVGVIDETGFMDTATFRVRVALFEVRELARAQFDSSEFHWADYDDDGRLDLSGLGWTSTSTCEPTLYRNLGQGQLEPASNSLPPLVFGRLLPGDVNGDSQPDLLISGSAGSEVLGVLPEARVWRNEGAFVFNPHTAQLTNALTALVWTDLDHDGLADPAYWGAHLGFGLPPDRLGDPAQGFALNPPGWYTSFIAGAAWADFDGDGDLDLAFSGQEQPAGDYSFANFLRVWRNDGGGQFVAVASGLPADLGAHLSAADVDGDGRQDLFVGPWSPDTGQPPRLWRNLGDLRFAPLPQLIPTALNGPPAWGDYDNDGDLDMLLISASDRTGVMDTNTHAVLYRNDGGALFVPVDARLPSMLAHDAAWGDADGDGDLDLVLVGAVGWNEAGRRLCVNTLNPPNTTASAPRGLGLQRLTGATLLIWTPALDLESGTNLTYNLRVGTTPGGAQIMSSLADSVTGRRRLGGPGNAGTTPYWRLNQLPRGTYYWSVQAVDTVWAGGPFAQEQTFRVGPPAITSISNQVARHGEVVSPFVFTVADGETPVSQLTVDALSFNPGLVPNDHLELSGTGAERSLTLRPLLHQAGTTTITLTLWDEDGESVRTSFDFTVLPEFIAVPTSLPAFSRSSLAWADADNDGDLDLLLGGYHPFAEVTARVMRNDTGGFSNVFAVFGQFYSGQGAWGDINHDGALDLFLLGLRPDSSTLAYRLLLTNRGKIGFSEVLPRRLPALGDSTAAFGDYDGDGDLDVLVSGRTAPPVSSPRRTELYLNDGSGNYTLDTATLLPGLERGAVAWADCDGDGDLDFVLTGTTDGAVTGAITLLGQNQDGGRFDLLQGVFPAAFDSTVAWADFNRDGRPDLLLAGDTALGPKTYLYRNTGNGNFVPHPTSLPNLARGSAAWGDVDDDGDPDLLLTGETAGTPAVPITGLYLNQGANFTPAPLGAPGLRYSAAAWGDFDNDGDLDLALSGATNLAVSPSYDARYTALFRHDLPALSALPPPAPINLASVVTGSRVTLSWSLPPSAPAGLSFNLRVGTAPGRSNVLSAPADALTGRLRQPQPGNAGWSESWRLGNLAAGTYYWSVQAVDAAYRGSLFTPETAFTITSRRPSISDIPDQTTLMNTPGAPVTFTVADPDSDPATLTVTLTTSNTNLLGAATIAAQADETDRVLTLTPALNQSGSATITVMVGDADGGSAADTFRWTVNPLQLATTAFPNAIPVALEPGDYDDDGDPDLFLAGWEPLGGQSRRAVTTLLQADGHGQFASAPSSLPWTTSEAYAAWGDYDGDGDLDLLHTGAVYRNDGGAFTQVWSGWQDAGNAAASWGDFDLDGDLDFAICGRPILASIYRNDGQDRFTDIQAPLQGVWLGAVAWCDSDNDGDLDLFVAGSATEQVLYSPVARLYRNNGGDFSVSQPLFGAVSGRVAWGDVNLDGRPDLAYAGTHGSETVAQLYLNLGNGQFAGAPLLGSFSASTYSKLTLLDWDNDGDLDLARHTASAFVINLNDGLGNFAEATAASALTRAAVLQAADFDLDADLDLVVGGSTSSNTASMRLYLNPLVTPPKPAPATLTAVVEGDAVVLTWPEDARAGTGAPLTYNIRVGSSPGRGDVLHPMSDLATGRRFLPQPGNAGAVNFHRLHGLLPGSYYWSVQTVDSVWRGSTFTAESEFIVAPRFTTVTAPDPHQIRFTAVGRPGATFHLEASLDLKSWSLVGSYQLDATGRFLWTGQPSGPTAFFRLCQGP